MIGQSGDRKDVSPDDEEGRRPASMTSLNIG